MTRPRYRRHRRWFRPRVRFGASRAFQLEAAYLMNWALAGHCLFGMILLSWRAR